MLIRMAPFSSVTNWTHTEFIIRQVFHDHKVLCVPSHFPVSSLLCLHPQNAMKPSSVALKIFGPRPEPA